MSSVLVIGGTRFIGRHLVREFLDAAYDVTIFNRGTHENPFSDTAGVDRYTGDRTSDAALINAKEAVDPDVVVDCLLVAAGFQRGLVFSFRDRIRFVR